VGDNAKYLLPATFFISFAAIGWQLALMRCLLISRYHHFSFLVISCALLGFGAGGVVLALMREWFDSRKEAVLAWGTLCFALSLPLCFILGESLPLNVYFPPVALTYSLGWWALFWLIHSVPFLLAGLLVGLALMAGGVRVHVIYASNLAGSAAGALGTIGLMYLLPANGLVVPLALSVLLSGLFLAPLLSEERIRIFWALMTLSALMLTFPFFMGLERSFRLNLDQFKTIAYVQRLADQGSAEKKFVRHGPRGRIELFSSPHFHTLLSLGSTTAPPSMDLLLRDGFDIGSVLSISSPDQARFLEGTLAALPFKLVSPKRVLILGESSGIHVWLARLSSADSIYLIQGDENVIAALAGHPSRVLDDPRIRVFITEPRAFLDTTESKFDIVHLAALEGFAAGSGGIGGLREDYLATVEGFGRCLDVLTPTGRHVS
jgi:MFS family permease